jgi:hypothetical protein
MRSASGCLRRSEDTTQRGLVARGGLGVLVLFSGLGPGALVVGGGYYVLDRLADPTEVVTLVAFIDPQQRMCSVRGARGTEYTVAARLLSPVPADEFYRLFAAG